MNNMHAEKRAKQEELYNSLYDKPVSREERRRIWKEAEAADAGALHAHAGEDSGFESSGNSESHQSRSVDDGDPAASEPGEICHQQIGQLHKKTVV